MRECERELLRIIQESKDPGKAIDTAMDILSRCVDQAIAEERKSRGME